MKALRFFLFAEIPQEESELQLELQITGEFFKEIS